jgi:hypothetical protein
MIGLWLKRAEHLLFRGIARVWGGKTVAKGMNAADRAGLINSKWKRLSNPVAIGLDASRFDQHVSASMLEFFEHQVYADWFRDPEFDELMSWQLCNKGYGNTPDGELTAKVEGCRMSGDMNTSMGNCLIMCAMVWSYCKHVGVDASLINDGDDCVVFLERRDEAKFVAHLDGFFQNLGFDMKVEPSVYTMEHIEFCQAKPVRVGTDTWLMVRNVERALTKDAMALINVDHPGSIAAWCAAVGAAGTAACGGIPILDSLYSYYSRMGVINPKWSKSYAEGGLTWMSKGMNRRGQPVLDITRFSFYLAFGILPEAQRAFEKHFDSASPIISMIPNSPNDKVTPHLIKTLSVLLEN